jgi:hypothetical protein
MDSFLHSVFLSSYEEPNHPKNHQIAGRKQAFKVRPTNIFIIQKQNKQQEYFDALSL